MLQPIILIFMALVLMANAFVIYKVHNKKKQHWQAGAIGGAASIQLGHLTRKEAVQSVVDMNSGPIVYVDDERGFIAFGTMPEMGGS